MQRLLNFDVVIEPRNGGYRTRVVASPAGEAQADFALPFTGKDLEILVLRVVGSIGRARRRARRIGSAERQLLEDFGNELFRAAFSGPVRECLGRSRLVADSRDAGLRIRLRVQGDLANIPWEYLYDDEHGFVGLSSESALVRYVELPRPVRPLPVSPPLRILAMISAPTDIPELSSDEEWAKLNDALTGLAGQGMVEVDRLEAGTLAALQRPLRLRDYHVLHFIGHGLYDEDAQDGALALEARDHKTRLVTGRDLGLMIRGHRSLRLVVLNACEGARSARDDPLGGVAQALVRQGIPAVIAMQFEISDPAAVAFSQSFYQAIADGLPVDVAMVEARRAMFAEGHEVEWATPVLYLRSPDGRVFTRGPMPDAERQAREDAERQAREDAERQAREDAERQAREDAERQTREEAEQQVLAERARSAARAGDAAGARDQYAALLPIRERVSGPEHPDTLSTHHELAYWTGEAGDAAGARDQYAALLPIRERVLGPEHPDTLTTRANLAQWTGRAGDPAAARDQFAVLLLIRERVLGPEHPDTLTARHNLAYWTGEAGDVAGARDQFAVLLLVRERVLGPEHPNTQTTRANLAHWTEKAERGPSRA
jgi:CHAT domain-containing protein